MREEKNKLKQMADAEVTRQRYLSLQIWSECPFQSTPPKSSYL